MVKVQRSNAYRDFIPKWEVYIKFLPPNAQRTLLNSGQINYERQDCNKIMSS